MKSEEKYGIYIASKQFPTKYLITKGKIVPFSGEIWQTLNDQS